MFFGKKNNQPEQPVPKQQENEQLLLYKQRMEQADLPEHALEVAKRELEKLEQSDPSLVEYSVGLNYLDLVLDLPWGKSTQAELEIEKARQILDAKHCGLTQVKERILEFLAVKTLRESVEPNVLIVDDEDIARSNIEHILTHDGYRCHCAPNGLEALKILVHENIDIIISDLKMDVMDGLELLAEVNKNFPGIPMIVVTGFATVDTAVKALKSGAAHYLGKPVNLNELRKTVKNILRQKRTSEIGRGPVLCFSGPPGTGKTSVGRAIAESLQMSFIRISLAGMRDEAELRGHRRTYVGAMPGRIINELKRIGVNNPVFMLDEIDKIGQDFRGDPASVMLEVLDPEQNVKFTDYYLDIPFDLSRIMFIATANDLSKLPGPLLDRMEVIEFSGYTEKEKTEIARRFIVPRQLKSAGLGGENITFSKEAVSRIINDYTRESGLRNLEREVANICRKLAMGKFSDSPSPQRITIEEEDIGKFLGPRKHYRAEGEFKPTRGITNGLVWSPVGGEVISVESVVMQGSGQLILTGSLGEILQESAHTALSLIRSRAQEFGIDDVVFRDKDIHIHFPAGAVSKDGPSAGVTIFAALLSLLTGRPARRDLAMTGEMTLSGRVLPVSGIREKLLAAQRFGFNTVFVPTANSDNVDALSEDVKGSLKVILIDHVDDLLPEIFADE